MSEHAVVLGGIDPLILSLVVFVATYAVIVTERINRAIVALLGAGVMIMTGILTQHQAVSAVDFNTIGLLTGMMIIVAVTQKSGVFEYVAIRSAKFVKADPWWLLVMLATVTALFSALLDNVTTVLLITPVTLLITDSLKLKPYPYLFTVILASNIGGTATLIGDPPNIMVGSAAQLTFNDFVLHLTPIAFGIYLLTLIPIYFIWGRRLHANAEDREAVMAFDEKEAIKDSRLLKQSMFVLTLVISGFVFAHSLHLEPATIAMFGAALLLLLNVFGKSPEAQSEKAHKAFSEVEWVTIFFFVGLFMVVGAIEKAGALDILAHKLVELTGGDYVLTNLTVLWVSGVLSAFVDNIPFVATMIPVIHNMGPVFGADQLEPLWWSLALGACLGGNGTLIGASANLVVAGFAERAGQPIRFLPFMMMALPLMVFSLGVSSFYIYFRYLI